MVKKKRKTHTLFTFDSLVQAGSAAGHWSDAVMSQVRCNSSSCARAVIYCVYQERWVLSNVLFLYVTMHSALSSLGACGQPAQLAPTLTPTGLGPSRFQAC